MLFKDIFIVIIALWSWLLKSSKPSDKLIMPLARVYDHYLYPSDLNHMGLDIKQDNKEALNSYIESWAHRRIVVNYAKRKLDYKYLGIDKKVDDYRNELIYHLFIQNEINKKLNINFSNEEINDHYTKNVNNFKVCSSSVLTTMVKSRGNLPNDIITKITSNRETDKKFLHNYFTEKSDSFFIKDSEWITLEELTKYTEHNLTNLNLVNNKNKLLIIRNAGYMYYIYIKDYRLTGQIAPLELVKKNVISSLIHTKRVSLQKKIEKELVKKAIDNGEYSLYKY